MKRLSTTPGFGRVVVAALLVGAFTSTAKPAAASQCMPRQISQNIKNAVLALKATQYCRDLPYTIQEAEAHVEEMRCNPEASGIIDDLLGEHEREYRSIFTEDPNQILCQQAALLLAN